MSMPRRGRRFPAGWMCGPLVGALVALTACQTPPEPHGAPAPSAPATPPVQPGIPAGASIYRVAAEESLLQILVYRGGPMARLGHNHVIASRHVAGEIYLAADPTDTRFEIRVPVSGLTVDEPALRASAGADFEAAVPQAARDGTRRNLLSPALLDADNHPEIRLRTMDVAAAGDVYDVGIEIRIKDQSRTVRVPVRVDREPGALRARGEFALRQTDLGLQPFSVAMGTLVVLDEMKVRFDVYAREADAP